MLDQASDKIACKCEPNLVSQVCQKLLVGEPWVLREFAKRLLSNFKNQRKCLHPKRSIIDRSGRELSVVEQRGMRQ